MKKILLILIVFFLVGFSSAQISTGSLDGRVNAINTAVPFLRIAPDARSGAMGDVGVAFTPDANAIFWNPAKLAAQEKDFGLAVSYTPWLKALNIPDIYLASLAGFYKLDKIQAVGWSLKYFSLGDIQFTDVNGGDAGSAKPNEFAIDGGYSRKLSKNLSIGIALRFIYSNLAAGQVVNDQVIKPATAGAADISAFYSDFLKKNKKIKFAFGANFSNIGSKISYTNNSQRDFIPMNMALGTAWTVKFDEYNEMVFAFDINKLLAPTPDLYDSSLAYRKKSVIGGLVGSFSDAPGGFKEEINELMYSFGIEYWYVQQFAIRAGYFYEDKNKGNRKFLTVGLGLKYNIFGLNFSYLVPTTSVRNPLDNTMRFSLIFDFDALKKKAKSDNSAPVTE